MPNEPQLDDEGLKMHVAHTLPVLRVVSTQLKETANQIETSVVDVCSKFQSMAERARSGVKSAAEILSAEGGSGATANVESLIAEASETIETLLKHTQDSSAVSSSAIERIVQVRDSTRDIAKSLAQLDEITVGNRLLAVNARIQAVYAGDKAAGFAGVANEIGVQARRSAEIVELIRGVSQELGTMANSALADLQRMVEEDRKAYQESKREVERVLEDFRRMNQSTKEFIEKMTQESTSVATEIYSAVRGLQFQDRINQRIGHVVEEINRIEISLGSRCSDVVVDTRPILDDLSNLYTMQEERDVIGIAISAVPAGEVELF